MSNILPVDSSYLLIKPIHASAELRYIKLATPEDSLLQWPYKSFFMPVSSLADAECIVLAARRSLFYRLKTLTESSQVLFLKRKYNFFSEYANMMTAAESTDLFKAKPIVKTDPIPDSLIVLELVRKHDTPDLIESANFFISTISVGYRSLFNSDGPYLAGNGSYNSGISPKI